MATNDAQQTLDRILAELKSGEPELCLGAIEELNRLSFSSLAIFRELERLAIHHPGEDVRTSALRSLNTTVHQNVSRHINKLKRGERLLLLQQIEEWEKDGLLAPSMADVLAQRYDFDIVAPEPAPKPLDQGHARPTANIEKVASFSAPSSQPPAAVGPRPSLTQTLLSEASIKIYLYLGAFFVIASALILAALVEAARLPILAVATLAFAGSAVSLRKRLPQPSFALFIVFSFLLPIDASVLKEHLGFNQLFSSVYWTAIFLLMGLIWGFSTWFYGSKFFSAVAYISLSLAFNQSGKIFNTESELQIFLAILASLAGLAATWGLRKWKDQRFSLYVFLLAQLQVLGFAFISLVFAIIHSVDSGVSSGWWLLITLTWLTIASFYVLSDLLTPFILFPWMAVAALLPLPWFFLNTFDVAQSIFALGFWAWGTVLALAGEAILRLVFEKVKRYSWPLLAGSGPLFLTAFVLALNWGKPAFTFFIFALTALVYAALHFIRPRWYVWSAALLSAVCACFIFFQLPAIAKIEIPLVYQLLIVSTLLVLPELFTRSPLSLKSETRWPALVLGVSIAVFGYTLAVADLDHPGRGALALIVYAVLITLHALHGKREWLGYFAAASESLALLYALNHFNLVDLWPPALTLLAVLYYAAGFLFRRGDALRTWGNIFIQSGLTLGALVSLTSLLLLKETSGWYILIVASLFAVELFARPFVWFELAVEALLSMSLYLILHDFNVTRIGHFLFGTSIIWLTGDLISSLLIEQKRKHRVITLGAGSAFLVLSTFTLLGFPNAVMPTIYFFFYTLFFALYAFLQREPGLGYLSTAFLSLGVFKFCDVIHFEKWISPLIALAVLYYAAGYGLRRNEKAKGWNEILLYSGLALAVLTSLAAPFQKGIAASIPVAIAATLFAAHAFARRNVWWALPANILYLMSYFKILYELNVDEPQFYSIGAALLGMLMHYLLTRADSQTGAFFAGMLSQLVLLGTTYLQMVSTEKLSFFVVLFIQSLVVLIYGLLQRSRSLVITPMAFAVIGVMTVVYSALKGLGPVILIGSTGVVLLMAGIVAVLMRERITRLGDQLSDWKP